MIVAGRVVTDLLVAIRLACRVEIDMNPFGC